MRKATAAMKPKVSRVVTREEIQQAIAAFRAAGGLIHKLPDEVVAAGAPVQSSGYGSLAVALPEEAVVSSQPEAA